VAEHATLDPRSAPDALRAWLERVRPDIDGELRRRLTGGDDDPGRLREAMRYAALGPGKRLRPALALAACEAAGGPLSGALPAAAAVEMLHAYTLVHDDLPAMDDDDLRRGRATVHVVFGEAIAILAGDGLLTEAFGALADLGDRAGDAVRVLARRAGAGQLLAGQARDLALAEADADPGLDELEIVHHDKTGALFSAAAELGGIAAGAGAADRQLLSRFGMAIGIAFQYADDRDDAEYQHRAAATARRMRALADEAAGIARTFGDPGATLLAFATWFADRA
jgi:geranylgeranyl pyrophosphate synthase